MTPLEIEIILHYYTRPGDYRNGDFSAPAVKNAIDWFCQTGMLELKEISTKGDYDLTDRGQAYVDALMALPLPEKRWIMPGAA